jgi:hypothetical protein|tara:strand:- start:14105 stop:14212 length:108 start_codon:yes stop_codon:yes gene_type:complete
MGELKAIFKFWNNLNKKNKIISGIVLLVLIYLIIT